MDNVRVDDTYFAPLGNVPTAQMITQCDPTLTRRDLAERDDPTESKDCTPIQCLSPRRTLSTGSQHVQR